MKSPTKLALATALAIGLSWTAQANHIHITPSTGNRWSGTYPVNNFDASQIASLIGKPVGSMEIVYKSVQVDKAKGGIGTDSGAYADYYETTYKGSSDDPSEAEIKYKSGAFISGGPLFLAVYDGDDAPYWYVFDITGWNGKDHFHLKDFWKAGGAISHVSILRGGIPVPDAGTTIVLLGLGLGAFTIVRRRFS